MKHGQTGGVNSAQLHKELTRRGNEERKTVQIASTHTPPPPPLPGRITASPSQVKTIDISKQKKYM